MSSKLYEWYCRQCSYYPPRWYWPIIRIFGGLAGAESGTCYLTRVLLSPAIPAQPSGIYQLYLHVFHREDMDRDPHDHPFPFWTFPLFQGYTEVVYDHERSCFTTVRVRPWRWTGRAPTHTHRIISCDRGWPLVTIVLRGPHERAWGFWVHAKETAKRVFIPWKSYVNDGVGANVEGHDEVCPGQPGGI